MDYSFFHSIVQEVYTDIPNPKMPPQAHLKELRRYAGAFDCLELGMEECYSYLALRTPGEDPVVYLGRTGRKHNAVSEGNFIQCAGWKQTGDVLLEHFDEILGTRFHTEAQVDAFAERGSVPSEEENPTPLAVQTVKVDREAIRAVLYGAMLRWQQGTPQVHIAVPKAEMGRYNEYVLGAVKTIWSYFPAHMRAAIGFSSFLSPRRERDFPKFTIIFVPYHMADVDTIRLDGSSPNAYAAMIRSTGIPQLDAALESLSALDDPEERSSFLRGIFDDVEKDADLKTRNFSPMGYVKWGRGLELLNARGSVSELLPGWVAFAKNKEAFPPVISRRIDKTIDERLTPEELGKALEQELAGARPTVAALDKTVEKYLPLCQTRGGCMNALWAFVRDNLSKTGLGAEKIYEVLSSHEESWGKLTDRKTYGELRVRCGREAAEACQKRAAKQMQEKAVLAAKRERIDSADLKATLDELREQFAEEAQGFVDEASLREMDGMLEKLQRGYVCEALKRELEQERELRPEGHKAIRAEQEKVARLARLVPPEGEVRNQLLNMIEDRKIELENLLNDSHTVAADLIEKVRGTRDYFEALELAAAQADKLSKEDQSMLRRAVAEKRPQSRDAYLAEFRRRYSGTVNLRALRDKKSFFRACVVDDLAALYNGPQRLDTRQSDAASLLRQIEALKRESELFGAGQNMQLELQGQTLDADMVQRVLGLNPADAVGQDKQQLGGTSMKLLRMGAFNPEQLCALLKVFAAANCKMDQPVKAVSGGEAGELTKDEQLAFQRQVLRLQMENKGMDREQAEEWLSSKLQEITPTPEAEAAFRTIAGEGKQKSSGKGLWIALVAVLGVLLVGAVLAIVFNWFGPKEPKGDEQPVATEAPADELAIEQAYAEGEGRSDGLLNLSGKGLDAASLDKILEMYSIKDALTESALDDEELLKSLGYRTRLDLSGNALEDVSALGSLTGLRRLYLANTPTTLPDSLNQLTRLELLDLRGAAVTAGQCEAFSRRLGDCVVLCSDDQGEMLILDGVKYRSGDIGLDVSGHGEALLRVANEEAVSSMLAALPELHLSGTGLKSLDRLALFSKLEYLDLSYSELTDAQLAPLYALQTLTMLELQGNGALSQEAVQNLMTALPNCSVLASPAEELEQPNLVTIVGESYRADQDSLDLSGKTLSEEDLAVIGTMTGLRQLDLSGTGITDLSFLKDLSGLKRLAIRENQVTDLSPLTALPELETLYADGNPLQNLGAGERQPMAALQVLSFSGVSGELDLSALQYMPKLTVLNMGEAAENPEAPLDRVFEALTELKILKLRSLSQLTETTRAALEARGCVILAPDAAPAEEPGMGELSGMQVNTEEKIMQNTTDEQAEGQEGEQPVGQDTQP